MTTVTITVLRHHHRRRHYHYHQKFFPFPFVFSKKKNTHLDKELNYRKIPKISPAKYKPPGACTWKIALKYKVKQSKNGKCTSMASPIDFDTQIFLRI